MMNDQDESRSESESANTDSIRDAVNAQLAKYWDRAKYFLYGFGILITVLAGIGILSGADVFRVLHNKAFPPEGPTTVAISYEGFLELTGDPRDASRSVSFYAEEQQRVSIYARLNHRFVPSGKEKRKVVVTVDSTLVTGPTDALESAFHDITDLLRWNTDFTQQPNVHTIVFSLDDTQPADLKGEVTVVVLILVFGGSK